MTGVTKRQRGQHVFDKIITGSIYGYPAAPKAVTSIVSADLFLIKNGPVRIRAILGHITTVIQTSANSLKLTHTPTGGAAVDLCAAADMTGSAQHKFLVITGTKANAIAASADLGVAVGPLATPLIVLPGKISLHGTHTTTGAVTWYVFYDPLTDDAVVEPA